LTILPPSIDFTDPSVTEAVFKDAITDLREYLNDMFGNDSASEKLPWKNSVRASTTEDITLSGLQTVDGESLVVDDRILVKDQTALSENGLYDVVDSGSWTRSFDMQVWDQVPSAMVVIESGQINKEKVFQIISDVGGTINVTDIIWIQMHSQTISISTWNNFL